MTPRFVAWAMNSWIYSCNVMKRSNNRKSRLGFDMFQEAICKWMWTSRSLLKLNLRNHQQELMETFSLSIYCSLLGVGSKIVYKKSTYHLATYSLVMETENKVKTQNGYTISQSILGQYPRWGTLLTEEVYWFKLLLIGRSKHCSTGTLAMHPGCIAV